MNKTFLFKITVCLLFSAFFLFKYINKGNELTKEKLCLPKLEMEVNFLKEDNKRLQYAIDQFENPAYLMELSRAPEYSHLKHPLVKDVLKVPEGMALKEKKVQKSDCSIENNSSY